MDKKLFLMTLSFIFGILIFTAPPVRADTSHCGTISSNETWSSSGNVHKVTCDVVVAPGVNLTIQEGTIIKFENAKSLIIDGTLRVLGSDANPVYFTSYRDDTIGGDTNGDGASNGARGDWKNIRFTDTSDDANAIIDHAIIRYGGESYTPFRSGAISR